jgi:hypothetical protein
MLMAEHVSKLHSTASHTVRLHAVQELRKHSRVVTNRATMGSLPGAMQQLVALLQETDEELREHATGTLCNLCCSCETNKAKIGTQTYGSSRDVPAYRKVHLITMLLPATGCKNWQ